MIGSGRGGPTISDHPVCASRSLRTIFLMRSHPSSMRRGVLPGFNFVRYPTVLDTSGHRPPLQSRRLCARGAFGFETCQDLIFRDRMLANADTASIVNRVR